MFERIVELRCTCKAFETLAADAKLYERSEANGGAQLHHNWILQLHLLFVREKLLGLTGARSSSGYSAGDDLSLCLVFQPQYQHRDAMHSPGAGRGCHHTHIVC